METDTVPRPAFSAPPEVHWFNGLLLDFDGLYNLTRFPSWALMVWQEQS